MDMFELKSTTNDHAYCLLLDWKQYVGISNSNLGILKGEIKPRRIIMFRYYKPKLLNT